MSGSGPQTVGDFQGSALAASTFRSTADLWHHRVGSTPNAVAMYVRDPKGALRTIRWSEAARRVRELANGLLASGVKPGDRCALLARSHERWIFADLAIQCVGAVSTPIHYRSSQEDILYILNDCSARVLFCEDEETWVGLQTAPLPDTLEHTILFQGKHEGAIAVATFAARGRTYGNQHPMAYQRAHAGLRPHDLSTLFYTSGTTGQPKGVMLSHDAWIYQAEAIESLDLMTPADIQLLFLPLSHVFAKTMQVVFIRLGVPTLVDSNIDRLDANLVDCKPTWFATVPLVLEQIRTRLCAWIDAHPPLQQQAYQMALDVALEVADARLHHEPYPTHLKARQLLAERLLLRKLRGQLGGRLRFVVCGGAPLDPDLVIFFHAIGVPILQGYGLTESAGAATVNRLEDVRHRTVGRPLPGTEIRLSESGEISIRNRSVMLGYYHQEHAEVTDTRNGRWLETGDLGKLLPDGSLVITGRKKSVLVTSGGKNIAPARLERALTSAWPYVHQVVVAGDGRAYCVAVIAVDTDRVTEWAEQRKLSWTGLGDLVALPQVVTLIREGIDLTNQSLSPWEQVRDVILVPDAFTVDNGLLTSTGKIRREAVLTKYSAEIEAVYAANVRSG